VTQLLAISSAALFGIADFAGGIATRRLPAWKVTAWTQLLGTPMLVIGLIVVAAPEVTRPALVWGAAGGLFGLVGLAIMYATLAAGAMSVVAPIIGAGAAIIPVIWAVATGESMSPIEWAGIVAAGGAVALLASQPGAGRINRRLFLHAMAALNRQPSQPALTPDDCLVIEDSLPGIRAARAAGMKVLAVANTHTVQDLGEADAITHSLTDTRLSDLQSRLWRPAQGRL